MKKFVNKYLIQITLISLIIISSLWLIPKGMPYQHDIGFHYERMVTLAKTIHHGDILALVHDAFYGYGYALGIFYGNFFFYLPAFLCLIGLPSMLAYKIFFIFINIGTVYIAYYVSKKIIPNQKVALLTTILYSLSEYRMYDVFVRGAIGETLAFMVIPLVMLGLYEIIYQDDNKWYLFSIGFVLLLLSHLITTILMAFFCIIIIVVNYKKFLQQPKRFWHLIMSGILGLLLGCFFFVPILEQYFFSNISIFTDGSVYLPMGTPIRELLLPKWFFSCYLGISIIMLIPIRFFFSKKELDSSYHTLLSFSNILMILGILSWLSVTNIFPWKLLNSTLSFIQFPWRLLLFSTLFFTISIGINLYLLLKTSRKDIGKTIAWFIILVSFATNLLYSVQYGIRKNHYLTFPENEIGNGEYLLAGTNRWETENLVEKIFTNNQELTVHYKKVGTTMTVWYSNNLKEDTYVELPLYNYLGYQVDNDLKIVDGNQHLIRIYLTEDNGKFQVSYRGTTIQKAAYCVSFLSLLGFGIMRIKNRNQSKK